MTRALHYMLAINCTVYGLMLKRLRVKADMHDLALVGDIT